MTKDLERWKNLAISGLYGDGRVVDHAIGKKYNNISKCLIVLIYCNQLYAICSYSYV